ncbi:MAG: iron-sulfur cluster repair di-iron protein [Sutterellaceae bacterium]|nr:iron-sulfur cluster repair di-iron protein [Sutterellaceae bacterium]MDD7442171.1 iron-sulfur cluster repair di-iron protein [Sutterellaceae bacterium]MDY2868397.1 iron-sulfur cluster repair di-iron protein [Mesosutterella sp.]
MANDFSLRTAGSVAAENSAFARVLEDHGVDFCCHGDDPFPAACRKAGADPDEIAKELERAKDSPVRGGVDFAAWPTDLLCDYVLKIHHRGIRVRGPRINALLEKVIAAHGARHPELLEVRNLWSEIWDAVQMHLMKEERMLYPYIYELCDAEMSGRKAEPFHCGTVASPISVMEAEHAEEGERHARIEELTHGYATPDDGCASYALLMKELRDFRDAQHEHIHLENNLIFPRALEIESRVVDAF